MTKEILRYRIITTAIAAGMVFGAGAMYLYYRYLLAKKIKNIQLHVQSLEVAVNGIRNELHLVLRSLKNNRAQSESDTLTMHSANSTDTEEDKFYDFSDDDELYFMPGELQNLYGNADELLKQGTEEMMEGYRILFNLSKENPGNAEIFWRLARACHIIGTSLYRDDLVKKQEYIENGITYAQLAVDLDKYDSEAHKWLAILIGTRAEYASLREKVPDGIAFKKHLDIALSLKADDPVIHHLLGRFKFEVASLSWIERKIVNAVFSDFPSASFADALENLLEAERLNTEPWKENRLFIAKCYNCLGNNEMCIHWLQKAEDVPIQLHDDENVEAEIQSLLSSLKN